jgi:hypothetical protein
MMVWVALGIGAYTGLVGLALGLCKASSHSESDRAMVDRWFDARRGQDKHHPAAA